jgi:hypothetical protein
MGETRVLATKAIRTFANSSVRYNKKVEKAVKNEMRVRSREKMPKRRETPTERPGIIVENTLNRFEHKIKAVNHESGKVKKPEGVAGMKIAFQIGGAKPASGADLSKSRYSGKMTFTISHSEADKGKPVYYSVCYENARGDQGPWSPVEEAFIG